jgi:L-lactate dehydrogenase complex protein LldF
MRATSRNFVANSRRALKDVTLQEALARLAHGFPEKRRQAIARLPEFDRLKRAGRDIKDHVLGHLDAYLELFEARVKEQGGHVHWARDAAEARGTILGICRSAGARTMTKSKSMIGEEIAINEHLEAAGVTPVETDMGEYIIQLRSEPPSHLIAPAIHLSRAQVADTFRAGHPDLDPDRDLDGARELLDEARSELRGKFIDADIGLTGANMLIAETGSVVIVSNEGNADLTQTLPRVHVVLASIEKVMPTLEDAAVILRLLARSATGQEITVYTTFSSGPRRPADPDGPDEFHVVLLDNGRTNMLGGDFHDMLTCIRCGACLNHCPVYEAVGGHAYGWVYSGPMGAVLSPALIGIEAAGNLGHASTLCGRCQEVCPMDIPLPRMLRHWRRLATERHGAGVMMRAWAFAARRPWLYRLVVGPAVAALALLGRKKGRFSRLPLAAGWTEKRDLPAPEGGTFMGRWKSRGAP